MDISSLSSSYLDQIKNDATTKQTEKSLKSDYSNASDEELMSACKQFESYFIEQMFKEMQKSVPKSDNTDQATDNLVSYFKDNLTQKYAEAAAEQQDTGLAKMLYDQMKRNYEV